MLNTQLCPVWLQTQFNCLFNKTLEHPLMGGLVEFAPIDFLIEMSNPQFKTETDTGLWHSPERLDFEALYQNMLTHGMRDAHLIGVGLEDRRIRLETGNQRVRLFKQAGYTHLPVVAYVKDGSCITHPGNGVHVGVPARIALPTLGGVLGPYPLAAYMKPSAIVPDGPWQPARL